MTQQHIYLNHGEHPSAWQFTNLYLYGSLNRPDNLASSSILEDRPDVVLHVDVEGYMKEFGVYVTAADFPLVDRFFGGELTGRTQVKDTLHGIYGKKSKYSKTEVMAVLKLLFDVDYFGSIKQIVTIPRRDNKKWHTELAYMWNSVEFMIHDDVVFTYKDDGTPVIENFTIIPRIYKDKTGKRIRSDDNFDFEGTWTSKIANWPLEDIVGPSRIGKKFDIYFENENTYQQKNNQTITFRICTC